MFIRFDSSVGTFMLARDSALTLIRMMGHSGVVPGAILARDLPAALESLKAGLAALPTSPPPAEDRQETREPPVTLRQRAFPLTDLLQRAIRRNCDISWHQEPGPSRP